MRVAGGINSDARTPLADDLIVEVVVLFRHALPGELLLD
jgi:hypothetical protein